MIGHGQGRVDRSVLRDETDRSARRMFGFSLLYLFLLFSALLLDRTGTTTASAWAMVRFW